MARSISRLLVAPVLCATLALSAAAHAAPAGGGPCWSSFLGDCQGASCAASPVGIGAGGGALLAGVGLGAFFLHRRRARR
jgi:MYXO-CTERM domain-containing protein